MAHEYDVRQQAEELYILEGMTLDQVAARADVPARTVEEWSRAEGWVDKRKEYRRALGEIRRNTVLYRLDLLKEAMKTLHPQAAFAWATVERTATEKAEKGQIPTGPPSGQRGENEQREIRTPEDAVNALQEVINRRLNDLLSDPSAMSLKSVKEMKDALMMVDQLKLKYGAGTTERQSRKLDPETIRTIKEEIYGIV